MLCPLCQSEIKDTAKFCGHCGKKVPRCPTCGSVIRKRVRFCVNDGARIPDDILDLFPETPPFDSAEAIGAVPVQMEPAAESAPSLVATRRFCVRCGGSCEPDQKLCDSCRQKETAETESNKVSSKWRIILLVLLLITIVAVGCLIWNGISREKDPGTNNSGVSSNIDDEEDDGRSLSGEQPDNNEDVDTEDHVDEPAEGSNEDPTQAPAEAPTEASTEAPTEASTEAPEVTYVSEYELIIADVSWQEAQRNCEARGGTLVTITSLEEFNRVCSYVEDSGLTYIWLGACIYSDSDEWGSNTWVTGEAWTFDKWYPGEPSKQDEDGTREFCLCMWNVKYDGAEIGWTFNDQRNDLVASFPSVAGKIGYICEYKVEVTR